MEDFVWRVDLNWYGEVHTFHTDVEKKSVAKANAITKLASLMDLDRAFVSLHFRGEIDNFKTSKVPRRKKKKPAQIQMTLNFGG